MTTTTTAFKSLDPYQITKYWKNMTPPDITQLRDNNEKYTDPYFPPNRNTLMSANDKGQFTDQVNGPENQKKLNGDDNLESRLEWRRMTSVKPLYLLRDNWEVFTQGKIKASDVKQGQLGDCYFLSSITAVDKFSYLIGEKFRTREYNDEGYYEIILFIDGEWQIVFVDDWFPFNTKLDELAFAKPSLNALWPIILEKAWAKVNGGYSNIIGGQPGDPLFALTRFPSVTLKHLEVKNEDIINELLKSKGDGTIRTASTRESGISKEKTGLVSNHAYTIQSYQAKDDIQLIKLRNPWGSQEWKGDWSPTSTKWTQELLNYFGEIKPGKGQFYIDIKNYLDYYAYTNICYLLFGANIKSYHFNDTDTQYFKSPLVFNVCIKEKGQTAITVLFKHWRFNRDIQKPIRPFSILLCKYDDKHDITHMYAAGTGDDDCSLIETLDTGNYILWVSTYYDAIKNDPNFKYSLSIASIGKFKSSMIGLDKDYSLLKRMVVSYHLKVNDNLLQNHADSIDIGKVEVLKNGYLTGYLLFNQSNNSKWMTVTGSITLKNYRLFPPYQNLQQFKVELGPKQCHPILGFRTANEVSSFNISTSYSIQTKDKAVPEENKSITDVFFTGSILQQDAELVSKVHISEYSYVTQDKASVFRHIVIRDSKAEPSLNDSIISHMVPFLSLKKEFPRDMEYLTKLKPMYDESEAQWTKTILENGVYFGECKLGSNTRHGRGCYKWTDKSKYLGYWKDDEQQDEAGRLYYNDGKLQFEGQYVNGKRQGKGVYYFNDYTKFEAIYENNERIGEMKVVKVTEEEKAKYENKEPIVAPTPMKIQASKAQNNNEDNKEKENDKENEKKKDKPEVIIIDEQENIEVIANNSNKSNNIPNEEEQQEDNVNKVNESKLSNQNSHINVSIQIENEDNKEEDKDMLIIEAVGINSFSNKDNNDIIKDKNEKDIKSDGDIEKKEKESNSNNLLDNQNNNSDKPEEEKEKSEKDNDDNDNALSNNNNNSSNNDNAISNNKSSNHDNNNDNDNDNQGQDKKSRSSKSEKESKDNKFKKEEIDLYIMIMLDNFRQGIENKINQSIQEVKEDLRKEIQKNIKETIKEELKNEIMEDIRENIKMTIKEELKSNNKEDNGEKSKNEIDKTIMNKLELKMQENNKELMDAVEKKIKESAEKLPIRDDNGGNGNKETQMNTRTNDNQNKGRDNNLTTVYQNKGQKKQDKESCKCGCICY